MGKSKEDKELKAKQKFERHFIRALNRLIRANPDIAILHVDVDVKYSPGYKNAPFKWERDSQE